MPLTLKLMLAALAGGALLGGCGVRGALEPPPQAKIEQQSAATSDSGQGKPAGQAPKPHRSFLLDGLID